MEEKDINPRSTRISAGAVTLGTSSHSKSFETETWAYIQLKNFELHYMQKPEEDTDEKKIPTTYNQRLAFFRCFVTITHNVHYVTTQFSNTNMFVWNYVITMILKGIPLSYMHMVLSAYSPHHSLFLHRMVPIAYGHVAVMLISSVFFLGALANMVVTYMNALYWGLVMEGGWNNCDKVSELLSKNITRCCNTKQFLIEANRQFESNMTYTKPSGVLIDESGLKYVLVQKLFFVLLARDSVESPFFGNRLIIFYTTVWMTAFLLKNQVYKTYIWKAFDFFHWIVNAIFILMCVHMCWISMEVTLPKMLIPKKQDESLLNMAWGLDVGFIAESISAPPLQHILVAKSDDEINPGYDSFMIETSNVIYYLFKGLTLAGLKKYCERIIRCPIDKTGRNKYPYFLLIPIYFSLFAAGEIMLFIFYAIHILLEWSMFIIIYQIVIDLIIAEFKISRTWIVSSAFTTFGLIYGIVLNRLDQLALNFYIVSISTMAEIATIVWLYPLGRFADDVTFHTGQPVSSVRIWCIRIMPVYYVIKLFSFISTYIQYLNGLPFTEEKYYTNPKLDWTWTLFLIPYGLGAIYIGIKMFRKKQSWRSLFRPIKTWGPPNFIHRQLRKQFDSRDFISSQSTRYVSRYIMNKRRAPTYNLNVYYDRGKKPSTDEDFLNFYNEKRNEEDVKKKMD